MAEKDARSERQERLSAQLRRNLKRRKQQARERGDATATGPKSNRPKPQR